MKRSPSPCASRRPAAVLLIELAQHAGPLCPSHAGLDWASAVVAPGPGHGDLGTERLSGFGNVQAGPPVLRRLWRWDECRLSAITPTEKGVRTRTRCEAQAEGERRNIGIRWDYLEHYEIDIEAKPHGLQKPKVGVD